MKKLIITLLKVGVSAAIIAFLVYRASRGDVFAKLRDEPKQWDILALAWLCCAAAVLITFVRWWYLVRALDVPCSLSDAIRISFWGYLFNQIPVGGIVGGDLLKTLMLAHEQPRHRAKALASVFADRVIGLYVLFLVCTVAILATDFASTLGHFRWICPAMYAVTLGSTIGLAIVFGPEILVGWAIKAVASIPRVGRHLESLISAVRMYRRRRRTLICAALATVAVHSLFSIGVYLIACGLPGDHPTLGQHFVIFPLSAALQVIPVSIGPTEFALDFLYARLPGIGHGPGLVVALAYRLIMVLVAPLGVFYYLGNRREVAEAMHEAEEA